MNLRALAAALIAVALIAVGYWYVSGAGQATQFEVPVEQTVDDGFGSVETRVVWEKRFVPGFFDFALPITLVAGGAALVLLWVDRRRRRAAST